MNLTVLSFQKYATAFAGGLIAYTFFKIQNVTDGHFIYSLDDPYIHLSLADSILNGEYGINAGEYASPSSSILYPFLMALGLMIGLGTYSPLAFTVPASLLAVWILAGTFGRVAGFERLERGGGWPFGLMGAGLALAINAVALPFTGMEHSIHVLGVVLALSGLYRSAVLGESGAMWMVVLGTVICGLIRFEGLALTLAMIIALIALGHWRAGVLVAILVGTCLVFYVRAMTGFGLPIFPSSVMMKSSIAADAADANGLRLISRFVVSFFGALSNRWGILFAVVAASLCVASFGRDTPKGTKVFLRVVAFTLFAHLLAGQYDWFSRYEVYAVAAMLFGGVFLLGRIAPTYLSMMLTALLLLITAAPYLWATLQTPAASRNIYQQQYQMHLFAQQYFPARVAVNDLGYVAFGNQNYVLDLWGLGSEEARRISRNNRWTPALLSEITKRHEIRYAMVYDIWFPNVPADWCRIGQLFTSQITSAHGTVSFYLIERDQEAAMRASLLTFAAQLPEGARMEIADC